MTQEQIINTFNAECITLRICFESKKNSKEYTKGAHDTLTSLLLSSDHEVYKAVVGGESYKELKAVLK